MIAILHKKLMMQGLAKGDNGLGANLGDRYDPARFQPTRSGYDDIVSLDAELQRPDALGSHWQLAGGQTLSKLTEEHPDANMGNAKMAVDIDHGLLVERKYGLYCADLFGRSIETRPAIDLYVGKFTRHAGRVGAHMVPGYA